MAIIYSYPLNDDIKLLDELVGTTEKNINGQLKTVTRNFLLADLAEFFIVDGGLQKTITLTTIGDSGPSTLNQVTGILNIPQYAGLQNLQQVTDIGSTTTNSITLNPIIDTNGLNVNSSGEGIGINIDASDSSHPLIINGNGNTAAIQVNNSDTGIYLNNPAVGLNIYDEGNLGTAISIVNSNGSYGIQTTQNTGTAEELNLGLDAKGLVINSETSSIGNPIQIIKNGVDKLIVNQQGEITAAKLIKEGGTGTNLLLDDGTTIPLTDVGNQDLQSVLDNGNTSNTGISLYLETSGTGLSSISLDGIGIYGRSDSNTGIQAYSNNKSLEVGLGNNTVTGVSIESSTGATGTPLKVTKNNVTKLSINQEGELTATKLIKDGGTGLNILLDNGTTTPLKFQSNIVVSLTGSKTLGKYSSGQTIPSAGKTFEQVINDIAIEYLPPTISSFSISGQSTIVESGTVISGTKSFIFSLSDSGNITPNTLGIYYGATALATGLAVSSPANVSVGTVNLTGNGTSYSWSAKATNTQSTVFTSNTFSITSRYNQFYGNVTTTPTTSADVRALTNNNFANINSWVTPTVSTTKFALSIPATKSLTSAITANFENITSSFLLSTFNVNDAGGNAISYRTYTYTSIIPLDLTITIIVA